MKKTITFFTLFALLFFFSNTSFAVGQDDLLKPDAAFKGSITQISPDRIKATWDIAEGYYLYRKRFSFKSDNPDITLGEPVFPKGKIKDDAAFGKVETYRHKVSIEIPIVYNSSSTELTLNTKSQGCADIGVCYPPQKKTLTLQLSASSSATLSTDTSDSNANKNALATNAPATKDAPVNKTPPPIKISPKKSFSLAKELGISTSGSANAPLPPDQAFALDIVAQHDSNGKTILNAHWNITPGHYLYQHKIKFSIEPSEGVSLGKPVLPEGKKEHDEYFGDIVTYYKDFDVKVPVTGIGSDNKSITVKTSYQGCSKLTGICYPPQHKSQTIKLTGTAKSAVTSTVTPTTAIADTVKPSSTSNPTTAITQDDEISFDKPKEKFSTGNEWLDKALNSNNILLIFFAALGAGLVLAFTACMYPMIPILSSIIVGQGEEVSAFKGFLLSAIYVLALAVTFGIVGALTASFASGVGIQAYFQNPWVLSFFALLFIVLAFSMFGFYDIQVPAGLQNKLSSISNQQKGGTFVGVAIMGALSALIIGPCGGPALAAMLTYAAASSSILHGFIALFALGLGMGLPLLVVGAGGGKVLPKAGNWMSAVKAGAGVILIAVSLIILERMPHLYSPLLTMMLWAMLLIVSGVFLGAFSSTEEKSGWFKFWKGLGLFFVFYGLLVMIGGQLGGKTVTDPFYGVSLSSASSNNGGESTKSNAHVEFKRIKSIADLKQEIGLAKQQNKAVMLDFYADWCGYCIKYERYIFPAPKVKAQMDNIVLLQADVTKMDKTDTELMTALGVSLPPAILFFGKDGKEIALSRIVGEMNVDEFSAHLTKTLK